MILARLYEFFIANETNKHTKFPTRFKMVLNDMKKLDIKRTYDVIIHKFMGSLGHS